LFNEPLSIHEQTLRLATWSEMTHYTQNKS